MCFCCGCADSWRAVFQVDREEFTVQLHAIANDKPVWLPQIRAVVAAEAAAAAKEEQILLQRRREQEKEQQAAAFDKEQLLQQERREQEQQLLVQEQMVAAHEREQLLLQDQIAAAHEKEQLLLQQQLAAARKREEALNEAARKKEKEILEQVVTRVIMQRRGYSSLKKYVHMRAYIEHSVRFAQGDYAQHSEFVANRTCLRS